MAAFPGGVFGRLSTQEVHRDGPASQNDATAKMPIGAVLLWNGNLYRYVRFDNGTGNVASAAGYPAWPVAVTPAATATALPVFTVTADQTDSVLGATPVGVFLGVVTDGNYCFIQIGGRALCMVPGGIEEDMIIGSTTDGQFGHIAAGSNLTRPMVGIRLEGASASGLSPVWLTNLGW